ncbi:helix-turn-helix domain containing protein [Stappia sp. 28M-7]|uniref:helix-turn-helix domain containing protein n=1 Tax=Stappia sp. 28M-7 TaxID=2762596 RepID=UPI001FD87198|nr:helix-turn-helix domain containing protein [Stappia sp. 28M-7]
MTTAPVNPRAMPDVPANLAGYIDALGVDGAIQFFCEFGGSYIYLPEVPTGRSQTARAMGADAIASLARSLGPGYYKVPLAKRWVAQAMFARGDTLNEIARKVRADAATVRRWRLPEAEQLDLFQPASPAHPRG